MIKLNLLKNLKRQQVYLLLSSCLFLLSSPLISPWASATEFEPHTNYQVCFTPQDNCTQLIVNLINQAHSQIRAEMYSFTSKPIAQALVRAEKRGVDVQIIYDASNEDSDHYSLEPYLIKHHIPGYIDTIPGIAHNKVLIIDQNTIETGSFNYTKAAQENNAENILIIQSPQLAKQYLANWAFRQKTARP